MERDRDGTWRDLRALAARSAAHGRRRRLVAAELLIGLLNAATVSGILVCIGVGGPWLAIGLLLTMVEAVSLAPLLVGAHWATVMSAPHRSAAGRPASRDR